MTMSAAQPADPEHPCLNARGQADVIDLTRRRTRGHHDPAGRWNQRMGTPPPQEPRPGRDRTDIEVVADEVELWMKDIRQSLRDERTAAVFIRALEFVDQILHGAVAKQLITEQQRAELAALFDAAKQAPEHL